MKMYYKHTEICKKDKFHCLHHNDADGYSSAAQVAYKMDNWEKENFTKQTYSKFKTNFDKDTVVFIVDLSFSATTYKMLVDIINNSKAVIWIDHHQTSIETFEKNKDFLSENLAGYLLSDNGYAACYLSYLYCNSIYTIRKRRDDNLIAEITYTLMTENIVVNDVEYAFQNLDVPEFIKLISDYDTWSSRYSGEQNYFNTGLMENVLNFNSEILYKLTINMKNKHLCNQIIDDCVCQGKIITDYNTKNYNRKINMYGYERKLFIYDIYPHPINCLIMNERGNSFMFGDRFYDENVDFGISVIFDGTEWNYSIFKNPNSNSSITSKEIAEYLGGGGHPNAAGFKLKYMIFNESVDISRIIKTANETIKIRNELNTVYIEKEKMTNKEEFR